MKNRSWIKQRAWNVRVLLIHQRNKSKYVSGAVKGVEADSQEN